MSATEVYSHAKQFVLENYTTKTRDMKRIIADMDIVIISNLKMIDRKIWKVTKERIKLIYICG